MIKALSEWRNAMNSDASTRIPPLKRRREEDLESESDNSSSDYGFELSESESDSVFATDIPQVSGNDDSCVAIVMHILKFQDFSVQFPVFVNIVA